MRVYKDFALMTPPCTEGLVAAVLFDAVFGVGVGAQAELPKVPYEGFSVSFIRHPYHWLRSVWTVGLEKLGIPEYDAFIDLRREHNSFKAFLKAYTETMEPGAVQAVFDAYPASSRIRVEDFPAGLSELIQQLGVHVDPSWFEHWRDMGPRSAVDRDELRLVYLHELEFCTTYEYY